MFKVLSPMQNKINSNKLDNAEFEVWRASQVNEMMVICGARVEVRGYSQAGKFFGFQSNMEKKEEEPRKRHVNIQCQLISDKPSTTPHRHSPRSRIEATNNTPKKLTPPPESHHTTKGKRELEVQSV